MRKGFSILLAMAIVLLMLLSTYTVEDLSDYQSDVKQVEIKGEVLQPGVYEVAWNATIADIIDVAKGLDEDADISAVNLNQNIEHKGVVVIPKVSVKSKVSLNSASVEELDSLSGIGPSIAQRIVEYRNEHAFTSIEEIKEVKGIGDKLFEKIKDDIAL